jgi:fatty acid amide hydrolase 2
MLLWAAAAVLALAALCTCLLLFRRPRWLLDVLLNHPSPLLVLLLGGLIVPTIAAECARGIVHARAEEEEEETEEETEEEELLRRPATELAALVCGASARGKGVTALRLTRLAIARIERLNPRLNAVVAKRYGDALAEAEAADAAVARGDVARDKRALWGVPVVVKECFELEGMPFTAGIKGYEGRVGTTTSTTMQRVQEHGMIIVASTNVSEGCMFHESTNPIYGLTRNVFDLQRTVGGSSGGCGCAVAAGMVPLAVTSDVGGSTRIPSFYNGLFGHKPTGGTVPNSGCLPAIAPAERVGRFCQLGPCARSSGDLMPLLRVLAGSDGIDRMVRAGALGDPGTVPIDSTLTVYNFSEPFMPWFMRCGFHPELRSAQTKAVAALRARGCKIVDIGHEDLPELNDAFSIWAAMLSDAQDKEHFGQVILSTDVGFLLREILLEVVTLGWRKEKTHTIPAAGLALLNMLSNKMAGLNKMYADMGPLLIAKLNQLLDDKNAVMLVPSILAPAPRHYENMLRFFSTSQVSIFNVTQHPATAVPMSHLSRDGLPLGVQLVAGHGLDHVGIAVAMALEESGVAGAPSRRPKN